MSKEREDLRIWKKTWQMGDVGDTVRFGVARTGYAVKNAKAYTRLKWDMMELQARLKGQLCQVGELVYATHTGHPTDTDVLQKVLCQIDALKAEMAEKEAELGRLCGVRFCPGCGGTEDLDHVFCSRCGRRLREQQSEQQE